MINIAHIHPMLVHFPLALLPVALGAQLLALVKGQGLFDHRSLSSMGLSLILIAAIMAVAASFFGDIALDKAISIGVPLSLMENHEELGTLSAVLLAVLATAEIWFYRKININRTLNIGFLIAGFVVLLLILTTAWFGGQLVYEHGVNVTPVVFP